MEAKSWIEIIAIATIPVAVIATITHRIRRGMGLGIRSIQFIGVPIVAILVLILGLERILEPSAIGALTGAFIGYVLSGLSKEKDE
ncbi:MAG TPA: hypothetical protein VKB89_30010 [Xanthobacteraceae bacterium]|nr:hypothetical protein [Xanthobacteraceae bacterium]